MQGLSANKLFVLVSLSNLYERAKIAKFGQNTPVVGIRLRVPTVLNVINH